MIVRRARPDEYSDVRQAYAEWGYSGGILDEDVVYIALRDDKLAGVVRRTVEHGVTMLRGMWIDPARRRAGAGTALLRVFESELGAVECWCVPFTHLTGFYGQIGFATIAEARAPSFLVERLMAYRAAGREMQIMRRLA